MAVKPADSDMVIGYQYDEFTCTSPAKGFIVGSHIYPGFMDKVSTLTHFPLDSGSEDYSFFWTPAIENFEHGLDSIRTDC